MLLINNFKPSIKKKKSGIPILNNNKIPCNQRGTSVLNGLSILLKIKVSGMVDEKIIKSDPTRTPIKLIAAKKKTNAPIIFPIALNKAVRISPIADATLSAPVFAPAAIF